MIYSHSRLSCFEQCPKKFDFQYVQKIKVPERQSIEAFMGKKVHETLEKLFKDLQHTKKNELHELLAFFEKKWKEDWRETIVINKDGLKPEHYLELGKKCITNFYEKNHPFDHGKPIGIEHKFILDLNGDGKYKLTGYIDLLIQAGKNHFQVHDYKTYAKLPEQSKMDEDEQLALYQLWVQQEFPEAKKIDLIWHYVVFQREGTSHRTKPQLEQLKKKTIATINKIESTTVYDTKPGPLCAYCSYKPICPAWKHAEELEHPQKRIFDPKDGVKLADQYTRLYYEKQDFLEKIENELEELKEQIFAFAQQHGYTVVQGTQNKLTLKTMEKTRFPGKNSPEREKLEELIRKHNLWTKLSELDTTKLAHFIEEGELDSKTAKEVKKYIEKTESKTIYVGKLK